jgi:hypothetical protein
LHLSGHGLIAKGEVVGFSKELIATGAEGFESLLSSYFDCGGVDKGLIQLDLIAVGVFNTKAIFNRDSVGISLADCFVVHADTSIRVKADEVITSLTLLKSPLLASWLMYTT